MSMPVRPVPIEQTELSPTWTWAQVRRDDEGIALRRWRHDDGERPHRHEFFELVLVIGGTAQHRTLERASPLRRGDVLWVPAGAWHAYERCRGLDIRMWLLNSELLRRDLGCLLVCPPWDELLRGISETARARGRSARTPELIGRLEADWREAAAANPTGPEGWLKRRAALLATTSALQGAFAEDASGEAEDRRVHVAVQRCRHLLDHRFAEPWTLESLAKESGGLHPSHLMRLFRAATGDTIVNYLTVRRLHYAANLLRTTTLPVTEIAARCGWEDAGYFARRFRAKFAATPGAFRRRGKPV